LTEKVELANAQGGPLGVEVFNFSPKSYLLIGRLSQFSTAKGVNRDQYSSFELFRGALGSPEIITFDELFSRAQAIVQHAAHA